MRARLENLVKSLRLAYDVRLVDKLLYDSVLNRVLLELLHLLLLGHLDPRGLPRRPVAGDERPEREGGDVRDALEPAELVRDGDHRDPEERQGAVDAAHEHGVSL